ncbi:MAG: hypothetical protein ABIH85_06965 [Candidatus Omnitrophota bacterium]|nr:hypothetical protein [Candidatus Omnitrophota bacterium]
MHKTEEINGFNFYRNDMADYSGDNFMTGKSIQELDEFFMNEKKTKINKFLKLAVKVLSAEKSRERRKALM